MILIHGQVREGKTIESLISLYKQMCKLTLPMKSCKSLKKELIACAQSISLFLERESKLRRYGETKNGSDIINYL
jgi:flagellar biosynthesis regulator FlaF